MEEANIAKVMQLTETLRLVPFDGVRDECFAWYRDQKVLDNVIAKNRAPYTKQNVKDMYFWQTKESQVFYIERFEDGQWTTIGDTAFSQHDLPIVIGSDQYRQLGIGKLVIQNFIQLAKTLEYQYLEVEDVFDYNDASIALFTHFGFEKNERTKDGHSYRLELASKY